ncbi:somatostatin receptor type 2-like [Montipora capricornis]|uniref:somatostatin receptor type 2-like n=1 Tax=Montipora capricornis TaxID=246305 RepID=UPI0035F1C8EE
MALPKSVCIPMLAIQMTEIVLIVMLNFITILVFTKTRFLRRRRLYLVLNLAVIDMLVGGLSETNIFLKMGNLCHNWKVPVPGNDERNLCSLHLLFVIASVTNLVAISIERMHATFHPLRHRFIKKRTYSVIITVIWATAASLTIAIVLTTDQEHKESLLIYYELNSFNAISLLVICACYASIAIKVHRGLHLLPHGAVSRERKLSKTLFILTVVSLLMWLPFTIGSFLQFSTDILTSFLIKTRELWFNFVCIVLLYANSLFNPTLYAFRLPDFRRAMISLFCRARQRRFVPVLNQNVMHRV